MKVPLRLEVGFSAVVFVTVNFFAWRQGYPFIHFSIIALGFAYGLIGFFQFLRALKRDKKFGRSNCYLFIGISFFVLDQFWYNYYESNYELFQN